MYPDNAGTILDVDCTRESLPLLVSSLLKGLPLNLIIDEKNKA